MALQYDLHINQGETWSIAFPVLDGAGDALNVAGWTVQAQIRQYKFSPVIFEWNTTVGNATASGTTVTLALAPTDTALWDFQTGLYDIELTDPDGNVTRLAEGKVFLKGEITR